MQTWDGLPVSAEPPFGATVAVWRDADGTREWLVPHRAHHGRDYDGEWAWTPPSACARAAFLRPSPTGCEPRERRLLRGLTPSSQVETS